MGYSLLHQTLLSKIVLSDDSAITVMEVNANENNTKSFKQHKNGSCFIFSFNVEQRLLQFHFFHELLRFYGKQAELLYDKSSR